MAHVCDGTFSQARGAGDVDDGHGGRWARRGSTGWRCGRMGAACGSVGVGVGSGEGRPAGHGWERTSRGKDDRGSGHMDQSDTNSVLRAWEAPGLSLCRRPGRRGPCPPASASSPPLRLAGALPPSLFHFLSRTFLLLGFSPRRISRRRFSASSQRYLHAGVSNEPRAWTPQPLARSLPCPHAARALQPPFTSTRPSTTLA